MLDGCAAAVTFSVIVCAFDEEQLLPGCLYSALKSNVDVAITLFRKHNT
jgi:hypothetical protein